MRYQVKHVTEYTYQDAVGFVITGYVLRRWTYPIIH